LLPQADARVATLAQARRLAHAAIVEPYPSSLYANVNGPTLATNRDLPPGTGLGTSLDDGRSFGADCSGVAPLLGASPTPAASPAGPHTGICAGAVPPTGNGIAYGAGSPSGIAAAARCCRGLTLSSPEASLPSAGGWASSTVELTVRRTCLPPGQLRGPTHNTGGGGNTQPGKLMPGRQHMPALRGRVLRHEKELQPAPWCSTARVLAEVAAAERDHLAMVHKALARASALLDGNRSSWPAEAQAESARDAHAPTPLMCRSPSRTNHACASVSRRFHPPLAPPGYDTSFTP